MNLAWPFMPDMGAVPMAGGWSMSTLWLPRRLNSSRNFAAWRPSETVALMSPLISRSLALSRVNCA